MLIPPQYRLMLGAAALIVAAAAGAVVNGWRLDGAHQRELAAKQAEYDALASTVREQNRAVETMGILKTEAEARGKLAASLAKDAITRAGARGAAAAASQARDCDGVMREAWEGWK